MTPDEIQKLIGLPLAVLFLGILFGFLNRVLFGGASDEKPKRSEDSFELGDDGELIDTFEPGAMTLDDLICQYDRRED